MTGISGVCPQGGVPLHSFIPLIYEATATASVYIVVMYHKRGREWYLEKRGSRKILVGSQNLVSAFDKS